MVGAVIGDLAAWTWEHDRKCFYEKLVSPEARLAGYGVLPIIMWPMITEGGLIHKHRLYMECGKGLAHARVSSVEIPEEWHKWCHSEYDRPIPFDLKIALIISAFIDSGFLSEERQSHLDWTSFFHGGKQEYYAGYIIRILRLLNQGKTKDEAIEAMPSAVINYYPSGTEHDWRDLLEYTTFAWRCFYYSWDFTSALHNAAKCNGNCHLAMMLTGAFAEAMYGCSYSMTKEKFGGHYEFIDFSKDLNPNYREILDRARIHSFDNRFFFKKNDAMTNVERHKWTAIENPYSECIIDSDFRIKMMKAYKTSWEERYGVYLDNGWFYVYRSHCILLRYKLTEQSDKTYRITDLQISDDPHAGIGDLGEVLYSLGHITDIVS